MKLTQQQIEWLLFQSKVGQRFTQDTPILPDCWIRYGEAGGAQVSLLLNPYRDCRPGKLAVWLREGLGQVNTAYNQTVVSVELSYLQLLAILPASDWWKRKIKLDGWKEMIQLDRAKLATQPELLHFIALAATLAIAFGTEAVEPGTTFTELCIFQPAAWAAATSFLQLIPQLAIPMVPLLWSVFPNRDASVSADDSVSAIKADASRRLYDIRCDGLVWAVLDSGIDARHVAFRRRDESGKLKNGEMPENRVLRTYDFSVVRDLLSATVLDLAEANLRLAQIVKRLGGEAEAFHRLRESLLAGRDVEWEALQDCLEIPYKANTYVAPVDIHGTHVGGILAGDYRSKDAEDPEVDSSNLPDVGLVGVCPDLELYDIRVLNELGKGDEFSVISALQFVRYLNAKGDRRLIHGVNLSLSILHNVANYACGRTPVCEECERLVASGVSVVVAAGNLGYQRLLTGNGLVDSYMDICITDPGNAESVITVGATHRSRPHTYGVSYFSSRGPTGDGRMKPDLVAPGEKIVGPIPGDSHATLDGTSMAAPHVSGACALLMARFPELVGQPGQIKRILCETATDLGRDRNFQGAGMLDTLRALNSV